MLVAFKSQLTNRFYPDGTDYIIFLSARTGNEFPVSRLFFFFLRGREREGRACLLMFITEN
jgi:hypothetical protein